MTPRLALAAAIALAATPAAPETRPDLLCGGVEPSWSLEMAEEEALFTAPDAPQIDYRVQHVQRAEGRFWPRVLTLLAPADTALAVLRPAACSDTMSDRSYDWTIDLLTQRGGEAIVLTGCCRVRPAE